MDREEFLAREAEIAAEEARNAALLNELRQQLVQANTMIAAIGPDADLQARAQIVEMLRQNPRLGEAPANPNETMEEIQARLMQNLETLRDRLAAQIEQFENRESESEYESESESESESEEEQEEEQEENKQDQLVPAASPSSPSSHSSPSSKRGRNS